MRLSVFECRKLRIQHPHQRVPVLVSALVRRRIRASSWQAVSRQQEPIGTGGMRQPQSGERANQSIANTVERGATTQGRTWRRKDCVQAKGQRAPFHLYKTTQPPPFPADDSASPCAWKLDRVRHNLHGARPISGPEWAGWEFQPFPLSSQDVLVPRIGMSVVSCTPSTPILQAFGWVFSTW